MDLEIRHLKLVRAVTSAGSLTGAGAVLNLTQSALSHQLRDIESRLGTPLFLRVGKRMMLTPAGERLLRSADEVLDAIERTEDSIRQLSGADRGLLRLSTEPAPVRLPADVTARTSFRWRISRSIALIIFLHRCDENKEFFSCEGEALRCRAWASRTSSRSS